MSAALPTLNVAPASGDGGRARNVKRAVAVAVVVLSIGALAWLARSRGASAAPGREVENTDVPTFDGRELRVPERFAQRAGVAIGNIEKGVLTPEIRVVGDVTYDPEHVAAVGARSKGFVRRVLKVEGDRVRAGEALAEIQSADLGLAQAEISAAAARRRAAVANAKRESDLLARNLTTAREAETAEAELAEHGAMLDAARQRVSAMGGGRGDPFGVYVMRSPIDGTVVGRRIDVGQTVDAESMAFRVADLGHLWVALAIFERSLGAVRVGDEVEVVSLADNARTIKGVVAHVGEVLDPATRSADVRVEVSGCMGKLRPGQSVQATIKASGRAREVLWVPARAVTYVDGKATVFVESAPGRVQPTAVKLGESDHERQELVEGVTAGQRVVVDGVFAIKSELFR